MEKILANYDPLDPAGWVPTRYEDYVVHSDGTIHNTKMARTLKRYYIREDYATVAIQIDAVQRKRGVARMVADAFLPPPEDEYYDTVMHLDNDGRNCNVTNLAWRPAWFVKDYRQQENKFNWLWLPPFVNIDTGEEVRDPLSYCRRQGALGYLILDNLRGYTRTPVTHERHRWL